MKTSTLMGVVCLLLAPAVASAQIVEEEAVADAEAGLPPGDPVGPPAIEPRAREAFREATALADAGDWAAALPLFEESQRLHPAPAILFDIGVCQVNLGRLEEAAATFERLLAESPDAPEPLRREAEARLAQLTDTRSATGVRFEAESPVVVFRLTEEDDLEEVCRTPCRTEFDGESARFQVGEEVVFTVTGTGTEQTWEVEPEDPNGIGTGIVMVLLGLGAAVAGAATAFADEDTGDRERALGYGLLGVGGLAIGFGGADWGLSVGGAVPVDIRPPS